MIQPGSARDDVKPAIRRLAAIADLDEEALVLLDRAAQRPADIAVRRELLKEGGRIVAPLLLLSGWAARVRILPDGRRQLIGFILPGEIVGHCGYEGAVAASAVVALTAVTTCQLAPGATPSLERAYAISRALDEAHLVGQIVRLGRLDAAARIIDLLLELNERLELAGLASGGCFDFPLTQELFADALGLTSVHVNRMVQQARRSGELDWVGRSIRLLDLPRSYRSVGRYVPRVV